MTRKAYGSSRIAGGKIQQILNWRGSFETFRKVSLCVILLISVIINGASRFLLVCSTTNTAKSLLGG